MAQRGRNTSGPGGRDRRARAESGRSRRRFMRAGSTDGTTDPEVAKADSDAKPERTIAGLNAGRAVILAVVVCALALTLAVPMRNYFTQRAEAARVAAERVELESDLARLQEKRAQQQDPAYIRAQARERLRLVMPGETPYLVQLPGAYEAEQARRAKPAPPPGPWYSELWKSVSRK